MTFDGFADQDDYHQALAEGWASERRKRMAKVERLFSDSNREKSINIAGATRGDSLTDPNLARDVRAVERAREIISEALGEAVSDVCLHVDAVFDFRKEEDREAYIDAIRVAGLLELAEFGTAEDNAGYFDVMNGTEPQGG
ncbi:MAG TPA: hypothetical protein VJC09_02690 [Candidatus Saccharimonadales bacterium]|nr:hypothetical protein [Candidatus Saccharimonadales bacterium]